VKTWERLRERVSNELHSRNEGLFSEELTKELDEFAPRWMSRIIPLLDPFMAKRKRMLDDGKVGKLASESTKNELREMMGEIEMKIFELIDEFILSTRQRLSDPRWVDSLQTRLIPANADKIVRYETMLTRQLFRTMAELERHQSARRGEVVPPPINLAVAG